MDDQIVLGSQSNSEVTCANCGKSVLASEAHCYAGKNKQDVYICTECKTAMDAAAEAQSSNYNYAGAILLGLLAGAVAGVIWYLIETITKYQIGYVAIGVGYLVAIAVMFGAGRKRGVSLQIISAVITIAAILCASYFSELYFVNDYVNKQLAGVAHSFIFVSPFNPELLKDMFSPLSVLIWIFGVYFAFRLPKDRRI